MNAQQHTLSSPHSLVKAGLLTALYITLTLLVAPVAFGPVQFRVSEALNFVALYNKRYVYSLTLGVFFVNFYQYGMLDMLVGGMGTFVFLWLARWVGEVLSANFSRSRDAAMIIKYVILIVIFSLSMFTIAGMLVLIGAEGAFWPIYISLAVSQAVVMTVGAFIMYPISKQINFFE